MLGKMRSLLLCLALGQLLPGCTGESAARQSRWLNRPCALALAPHSGEEPIDGKIRQLQVRARKSDSVQDLEQLGWLFVAQARRSYDPGFYKLAEQCALCIESKGSAHPAALLLRGHALHNQHRFEEAEQLARRLTAERGLSFDFGLLGDVLLDQGKLDQAADAYQRMVDLRPGMRAYSRAAQLRWLKGDLKAALRLMRLATQAASPRDAEAAAWSYARLALFELQAGDAELAAQASERALELVPEYAPALLARGRILLAQRRVAEAADTLQKAAQLNPLPEYAWASSEALRAAGRLEESRAAERLLAQRGMTEDPRTLALYLSTQGEQIEKAVGLARQELKRRQDIYTFDALAWALQAQGRVEQARQAIRSALAEGTQDARIFLHAGVIESRAGALDEAARYLDQAKALQHMLLPSEKAWLTKVVGSLADGGHFSED